MDKKDNVSPLSNIIQILVTAPFDPNTDENSGLSGGALAGIIIGCLTIGFALAVIGYFVYQKIG